MSFSVNTHASQIGLDYILHFGPQNKEVIFGAGAGMRLYPDEAKLAFATLEFNMLKMLWVLKVEEAVPGSGVSRTLPVAVAR